MEPFYSRGRVALFQGDNLAWLRSLPDESVDSLVCDPPAGIGFMGKTWDKPGTLGVSGGAAMPATTSTRNPSCRNCGGRKRAGEATKACSCEEPDWNDHEHRLRDRQAFVAWLTEVMREALRVLKPGAHGVVWALPRTSHWTATALEDAGFEVREILSHVFGTGFPKSLNVSRAIDDTLGAEREVVGPPTPGGTGQGNTYGNVSRAPATAPATAPAIEWQGFGTATKPATEHWILVRKPLSERNVALNVLKHGCGALNIDGCRVVSGETPTADRRASARKSGNTPTHNGEPAASAEAEGKIHNRARPEVFVAERPGEQIGRWPPNLLLSHSADCVCTGTEVVASNGHFPARRGVGGLSTTGHAGQEGLAERHTDGEEVAVWECAPGCPVAELDRQSGTLTSGTMKAGQPRQGIGYRGGLGNTVHNAFRGSTGGASRFFPTFRYVAKPAAKEKTARGRVKNIHPTSKGVDLMRWLTRLVTPPGGTVIDCFMGSGSTGVACVEEGFGFLGCDQEEEYCDISRGRIEAAQNTPKQTTLDL